MVESGESNVDQVLSDYDAALRALFVEIAKVRKDTSLRKDVRESTLRKLYSPLGGKDIKNHFANDVTTHDIGVSFRASISHTRLWKKALLAHGCRVAPAGNPKDADRKFAQALGIPVPAQLQSQCALEDIELTPNTIVKPLAGAASRGVLFVDQDLTVTSLATKQTYSTLQEAASNEVSPKILRRPTWMKEQALRGKDGSLAHDWKVYTFYGEPQLILEIQRSAVAGGKNAYCFYRPDGTPITVDPRRKRLRPSPLPDNLLIYASQLSFETPVPYIRADFLSDGEECYLGEITGHPGGTYYGEFLDEIDKELGWYFFDAEARLYIDLLRGKSFKTYFDVYPQPDR